ncbi:hypothetical protein D3C73_1647890 [compost metagenome]
MDRWLYSIEYGHAGFRTPLAEGYLLPAAGVLNIGGIGVRAILADLVCAGGPV